MKKFTLPILLTILLCCAGMGVADEGFLQVFAYENGIARYTNHEGKVGIVESSGNILVPAKYDDIGVFDQNGLAITSKTVNDETYYGLINQNGITIADDTMFLHIEVSFHPDLGYSNQYGTYRAIGKDGESYAVFSDGTIAKYPDNSILNNNAFWATLNANSFFVKGSIFLRSAEGWRLFDMDSELLSPDVWSACIPFPIGGGAVQKDELWGIIDHNGKLVVDYQYTNCPQYTSCGIVVGHSIIAEGSPLWGVLSFDGQEVLPLQYDYISTVFDEKIVVAVNEKYGYMTSKFEWAIQPQWETASDFHHRAACVSDDGKTVVIDESGNVLITLHDTFGKSVFISDRIAVYDESKESITVYDRSGEVALILDHIIITPEAQEMDGLLPVGLVHNDKVSCGYLDINTGKIITEPQWCEIGNFENGFAIVQHREGNSFGVINSNGDYIIEPIYSSISRIQEVDGIYFEAEVASDDFYDYYLYNSIGEIVEYIHYATPLNG